MNWQDDGGQAQYEAEMNAQYEAEMNANYAAQAEAEVQYEYEMQQEAGRYISALEDEIRFHQDAIDKLQERISEIQSTVTS